MKATQLESAARQRQSRQEVAQRSLRRDLVVDQRTRRGAVTRSRWNNFAIHNVTRRGIFNTLCQLVQRLGFQMRISGSHHFFRKSGVPEAINLQPADGKAKTYQVRQARKVLQTNGLI